MKKGNNLIRVFTGTEINADLLKDQLEEIGIAALVKNDYQSGISVGFVGGTPSSIDVYIQESDLKEAEPIINEFNLINN
ncbi:MAG: DUF2007 domain-containing protein [Bacteroidia bacterium]|nr:DUF2007 domain-containing protein [Bacteroidia bacterium]